MEIVKPIPIQLDKERHLKLTLGGMKSFADKTGKSILKGEVDFSNLSESDIIAFLWACLIWEDRKLTIEDVGFMLDFTRIQDVVDSLVKTASVSFPEKSPDDESKNAQSPQNGSNSGQ